MRVQRSYNLLQIERNTTKELAHNIREFSIVAPIECKKLDIDVRSCKSTLSFKTSLKTNLFIKYCLLFNNHEHILPFYFDLILPCYYKHFDNYHLISVYIKLIIIPILYHTITI